MTDQELALTIAVLPELRQRGFLLFYQGIIIVDLFDTGFTVTGFTDGQPMFFLYTEINIDHFIVYRPITLKEIITK